MHRSSSHGAIGFVLLVVVSLAITPLPAEVVRQLTDVKQDGFLGVAIDDAGTVVVAVSSEDTGSNPAHAFQIVKWELPGPVQSQVTVLAKGAAASVSVSDDGARLAFVSPSSPTGQNHDGSLELFAMSTDGSGMIQLTDDPGPVAGEVTAAMLAGSGGRIAFASTSDPLGTNPARLPQLFVIDADGTGLAQLTSATSGELTEVSISDDGQRIAFVHSGDLTGGNPSGWRQAFRILADGSGLAQMSAFAGNNAGSLHVAGNGGSVVYGSSDGNVYLQHWGLPTATVLVAGSSPSITDDGKWVYYVLSFSGNTHIFVVGTSGGGSTQVTTAPGVIHFAPVISGGNVKLAFSFRNGAYSGGTNPDGGAELGVSDAAGTGPQQLTQNDTEAFDYECDMTADGSRVVFGSTGNLTGGNPDGSMEVYRIDDDGGGLVQLTADAEAYHPEISDDGQRITFFSFDDLTGDNTSGSGQIFAVLADGSGLTQLTPDTLAISDHPTLAGNGSVVVFQSTGNFAGGNGDASPELFAVPLAGGPFVQLTADDDNLRKNPQIDRTGTWVAYHSASNFDGANPAFALQVLRARVDGTLVQRITTDPAHGAISPDISADGNRIAFVGAIDPLGTNADNSVELFVWDGTTGFIQLTFTAGGGHAEPRISDDGQVVFFLSEEPFFGPVPSGGLAPYRVDVGSGTIQRAGGLADPRDGYYTAQLRNSPVRAVDADGSRFAFVGLANPAGGNLDFNSTLFLAIDEIEARILPGRDAPTIVTWEAERRPVRYDVIRGDVANLADGGGGTVDLGAVVCLENESIDNTTDGFGDSDQPASGQVFFFLYRGTQGGVDGPGSYGQGSGGSERLPAGGDCAL